jgi:spermidine synthase
MTRRKRKRHSPEAEAIDGREAPAWRWIATGLALATCATLLLELVATRIFSVVLIYHFAFMAICLALFGVGLAGVVVYLWPARFNRASLSATTGWMALLFALSIVGALVAFHVIVNRATDWPLPFSSVMSIFLVMAVPFFFSGMAVAIPISRCPERIGWLYGADLVGAAIGTILVVPLLHLLGGPQSVVAAAVLACAAAVCFAVAAGGRRQKIVSAVGLLGLTTLLAIGSQAELFALHHSRAGPETRLLYQEWNSFSRVSVWGPFYSGSRWRIGQGAPVPVATDGSERPTHLAVVIDGGAQTPMPSFDGDLNEVAYFGYDVTALPYHVRPAHNALIIGTGGGRDILTARLLGVEQIQAVEINPLIVDIARNRFREFSGDPYGLPGVEVAVRDGRSFAAESHERYDVVQLAAVDTFAATGAGALALVEHSLYTVEAYEDYYDRLSDDGILAVTHLWGMPAPERALRTADLVRKAWRARGVEDPSRHIIIVGRRPAWGTLLASRRPFTDDEVEQVRRLTARLGFGLLYAPGASDAHPAAVKLLGPEGDAFLREYPLDVSATTDDRPFFFFFDRPGDFLRAGLAGVTRLPERRGFLGEGAAPTLLVRLLVWMVGLCVLLIFVLPMVLGRMRLSSARGSGRNLLYFACIGLGFIMIEIPLIQRFTLLLGKPIFSFALILGCILIAAGIGSALSARIGEARISRAARVVALSVVVGGLLHAFLGPVMIHTGLRWGLALRIVGTLLCVAPLGLIMGMALPLGVRMTERRAPAAIAWGWGINGSLSVIGTILAMMLSVTMGMTAAVLVGVACYGLALFGVTGGPSEQDRSRTSE